MKNLNFLVFASLFVSIVFIACDSDDADYGDFFDPTEGCYIVNSGMMGENDGSIQYYDFATGVSTPGESDNNIFVQQNGSLLGDVAQDLLWVKDKLFVTVSGSQKIEILNENGKRLREPYIFDEEGASPRMLATDGEKVYATNYDGNVYVYDAVTAEFIKTIPVGTRPEGISCCNGYLVVNNSGNLYQYNGTVMIINLSTEETKTVKLTNPYISSVVCNGDVYIIDAGNYIDIPSGIYRVSPEEGTVESLGISAALIAARENVLYYVNTSYAADWSVSYSPLYAMNVLDSDKREIVSAAKMENIASLSVNPGTGDIFAGYNGQKAGVLGVMRIYDAQGVQQGLFDVGIYTAGARFEN